MSLQFLHIRGEAFVTLETAAECYQVEMRWIEEIYRHGFLGRGERVGSSFAVPAAELDRLAAVVRWHHHHGFDLDALLALFGDRERA
jgi:hypothetical protein